MKSTIEINTLPRDPSIGWQFRLNEVQAADREKTKFLASHHLSQALDHEIYEIRRAMKLQSYFAKMSKSELKAVGAWQSRDAAKAVFWCFQVMDRLEPGIAAMKKLAGGDLPADVRTLEQQIWHTLKRVDQVREKFYTLNSSADRPFINLSDEIEPLCDELENHIIALYTAAQLIFGLDDLNAGGMQ